MQNNKALEDIKKGQSSINTKLSSFVEQTGGFSNQFKEDLKLLLAI
jgi:hypothetical protein